MYDLTAEELNTILENFSDYLHKHDIEDHKKFLEESKSTYKSFIKETKLKKYLRKNIEKRIKNSLKIVKKALDNENVNRRYKEYFLGSINYPIYIPTKRLDPHTTMWTEEEIHRLLENLKNITEKYKVANVSHFFIRTSQKINKLKGKIHFNWLLAQGITGRSAKQCHDKAYHIFTEKIIEKRPWTPEEENRLLELYNLYKNRWTIIGEQMGRSRVDCSRKFRIRYVVDGDKRRVGPWSDKESKRLRKAVARFTNTPIGTFVSKNIPWQRVSTYVKTRTVRDCYKRWFFNRYCRILSSGWKVDYKKKCSFVLKNFAEFLLL